MWKHTLCLEISSASNIPCVKAAVHSTHELPKEYIIIPECHNH